MSNLTFQKGPRESLPSLKQNYEQFYVIKAKKKLSLERLIGLFGTKESISETIKTLFMK